MGQNPNGTTINSVISVQKVTKSVNSGNDKYNAGSVDLQKGMQQILNIIKEHRGEISGEISKDNVKLTQEEVHQLGALSVNGANLQTVETFIKGLFKGVPIPVHFDQFLNGMKKSQGSQFTKDDAIAFKSLFKTKNKQALFDALSKSISPEKAELILKILVHLPVMKEGKAIIEGNLSARAQSTTNNKGADSSPLLGAGDPLTSSDSPAVTKAKAAAAAAAKDAKDAKATAATDAAAAAAAPADTAKAATAAASAAKAATAAAASAEAAKALYDLQPNTNNLAAYEDAASAYTQAAQTSLDAANTYSNLATLTDDKNAAQSDIKAAKDAKNKASDFLQKANQDTKKFIASNNDNILTEMAAAGYDVGAIYAVGSMETIISLMLMMIKDRNQSTSLSIVSQGLIADQSISASKANTKTASVLSSNATMDLTVSIASCVAVVLVGGCLATNAASDENNLVKAQKATTEDAIKETRKGARMGITTVDNKLPQAGKEAAMKKAQSVVDDAETDIKVNEEKVDKLRLTHSRTKGFSDMFSMSLCGVFAGMWSKLIEVQNQVVQTQNSAEQKTYDALTAQAQNIQKTSDQVIQSQDSAKQAFEATMNSIASIFNNRPTLRA